MSDSLQKFGDSKMYKIFLFVGSLFLAPSSSRHIFQNRRENSGMANILDTNILKLERELSAASQIAEILEAKKYNKMKVSMIIREFFKKWTFPSSGIFFVFWGTLLRIIICLPLSLLFCRKILVLSMW